LFGISVFAQSGDPFWYTNKSIEYPDSEYVSSIGSGNTESAAKTAAVSEISLFFKTSADVRNESVAEYNKAISGNKTITTGSRQSSQSAIITSQEDFLGVRFTSAWHNSKNNIWYVLAYINKREAAQIYQSRIDSNIQTIQGLLSAYNKTSDALLGYPYLQNAAAIAVIVEQDVTAINMMGIRAAQNSDNLKLAQKIIGDCRTARSSLTFAVQVTGDRQNKIQRKILALLEKNGFTASRNNSFYTIVGDVYFDEQIGSSGVFFVSPGIELMLVGRDGKELFSYSANIDREGHKTKDGAETRAVLALERDLENNFITEFNAFLGD
jgi:hypothetical protein